MTPERYQRIQSTLAKRQPDLTVITDEVYKPHNLAAIARTCDAVGIPRLHSVRPTDPFRLSTATMAGSNDWIEINHHDNIEQGITSLQESGMTVIAAHLSDEAINYRDYDFCQPTALLMGTEKEGVSDTAAKLCDHHVIIPMQGMVESFNVSVAAAIILNEAQCQRQAAGFYDQRRLPEAWFKRLEFEWCQPSITKLCQQVDIPYPELRDDGELADPQAFSKLYNELMRQKNKTS